jgi:rhodanese-related sulfurtransferase
VHIEEIFTGCLAQGAYNITSEGEAAIIDPLREVTPNLDRLKKDGVRLKYIFETHFHADFVSGHLELAQKTGAAIVYGPTANPGFEAIVAEDQPILLVVDPGRDEEAITRLARVGFDQVLGYLNGGISAWVESGIETDRVNRITAEEFARQFDPSTSVVFDVRKETEYAAEHAQDAFNRPLAYINDWIRNINPEQHLVMHCAGGYRSLIAASILLSRGYRNFTEIAGGFSALSKTHIPKTD